MREDSWFRRVLLGLAVTGALLLMPRLHVRTLAAEDVDLRAQPGYDAPSSSIELEETRGASYPLDAQTIAWGRDAFDRSCVSCHDAQRATGQSKSYQAWLGTVQRMAAKDGADIRASDVIPIATYLASLSGNETSPAVAGETGTGWTFGTTVSLLHRSASDEAPLENPGMFADVWVTAAYQSSGPWRATVTACTSCHSSSSPINAYSLELVEGSATIDLRHLICGVPCDSGPELLVKMGRFIVPFGAFSAMSHPSVYRTVTNPLLFNMGRRVLVPGSSPPQQPVLPLPFSDEGINFSLKSNVIEEVNVTLDTYAINGLIGTGPNIFNRSRLYSDNNEEPAVGGRATIGGDFFRLGTSVQTGNLDDQGLPAVDYDLVGADATVQLTQRLRYYFDYARRRQDSVFLAGADERASGFVHELEYQLLDQPYVGLLARYDQLEHESPAFGNASLDRFTWGLNVGIGTSSLLMINHEHWMPENADDVDVLGIRWMVTL